MKAVACLYIENFWDKRQEKWKKVSKPLNGSTNRPVKKKKKKKLCSHFRNVRTIGAQSQCKLKCTQSQESLHQILKWKRIFSHRDRRWWLTLPTSQVWILAPSCQGGHCQSRPNGHKSNNDPRPSLSNLCKSVQDFTKLNPQESSTDFDLQNLEISSTMELPRATTRHHRLRRSWPPSLLCKLGH